MPPRSAFRPVLVTASLAILGFGAAAQTGIGTTAPDAKAALEIAASDKGLLIPRLDSVQRTGISAPPQGLIVYQTDGRAGIWYFQGSWQFLKAGNQADNLGNHTATQPLNLGTNQLVGNGGTSGVAVSSTGAVKVAALAGTGPGRLVTLADDGTLLTQPPPFGSTASSPQQPVAVGAAVATGTNPWSVAVNAAGTRAYVINRSSNTLQAYNVSNPAGAPVAVGAAVTTGAAPYGVVVNAAGTRAYVVNQNSNTLQAYDISNLAVAPVAVGAAVGTGASPAGVVVNAVGTRAYVVTAGSNTLQAYDISNPAVAPVAVGAAVVTGNTPLSVAVNAAGTRAYVLNYFGNTLQALDISNPAVAPVAVGAAVATGTRPISVAVNAAGTRAYVVHFIGNTLQAYDVSNPAVTPVAVGAAVATGAGPQSVAVHPAGIRAYVVNRNSDNLQAYDISNPAVAPVAVGAAVATGSEPTSVTVNAAGTRAYVVNFSGNTLQAYSIGTAPLLVAQGANGSLGSIDPATLTDNLGNHTATQALNLGANRLVGNGGTNGISISNAGDVTVAGTIATTPVTGLASGAVGTPTLLGASNSSYLGLAPAASPNNNFRLPDPATCAGRIYLLRNNSATNAAVLTTAAGLLFNGSGSGSFASYTLPTNASGKTIIVFSDGVNWTIGQLN